MQFGPLSLLRLRGVHGDLVRVVKRAAELSDVPFIITEGLRSEARQRQMVKSGASQTMKSRHLTGHAVDVAPLVAGRVSWDWPLFPKIAAAFKRASAELDIPIEWGGAWRTLKDGPHFQLPWKDYP